MSPACYRYFDVLREQHALRANKVDATSRTARLVFEVIMSAPDLPAEPRPAHR